MPKSDSMQPYTIKFEPAGSEGTCLADESLLTCAQTLGINVTAFCNGTGTCRACAIRITQGAVSEPTSIERNTFPENALREGWRLACQTFPRSECQLFLPETSQRTSQRLQTEGDERHVTLCPPVRSVQIELEPPSRDEVHTDAENLRQAIKQQHGFDVHILDIELLRTLSADIRALRWQCNAYLRQRELIGVTAPTSKTLGVAVDLGTTKIAGYVVDLSNGKTLAARGFMNPQIRYGEEIISRLQYALQAPSGEKTLQKILIEALNQLIRELCEEIGSHRSEIVESVIVGNTAMHHILLKLPVRQLAMAPFVPALRSAFDVKARDIGLHIASGANLHVLPNIAGFVGADHTAALVATAEEWKQGKVLVLDIGTNTEASLTIDGKISSLSCASGPAFEGFHIKDGMRSAPGAIEKVWFHKEEVCYETVAGTQPIGICGSGILDVVAQLYLAGIVNERGEILPESHPQVSWNDKKCEFILVPGHQAHGQREITITQQDIREILVAKAAIQAGIQILLRKRNLSEHALDTVILAGAFGSYIDVTNAITIGMLPSLPLDRFMQVGNAAGIGAKLALLSTSLRTEAQTFASQIQHIGLATVPQFAKTFARSMYIGC